MTLEIQGLSWVWHKDVSDLLTAVNRIQTLPFLIIGSTTVMQI